MSRAAVAATPAPAPVEAVEWGDSDRIAELADEAVTSAQLVDHGIGSYEYWGFRGVDTDIQPEVETDAFTVKFPVEMTEEDEEFLGDEAIPPTVTISITVGGCDGEHRGRCRPSCKEHHVELVWKAGKPEKRSDGTYVTYSCSDQRSRGW